MGSFAWDWTSSWLFFIQFCKLISEGYIDTDLHHKTNKQKSHKRAHVQTRWTELRNRVCTLDTSFHERLCGLHFSCDIDLNHISQTPTSTRKRTKNPHFRYVRLNDVVLGCRTAHNSDYNSHLTLKLSSLLLHRPPRCKQSSAIYDLWYQTGLQHI